MYIFKRKSLTTVALFKKIHFAQIRKLYGQNIENGRKRDKRQVNQMLM